MVLVDTSIWVEVLRDAAKLPALRRFLGERGVVLSRFTQLELLSGCRDEAEWNDLALYLREQVYVEPAEETWRFAARTFFDLARRGRTVGSVVDCCIAQAAIENDLLLLHRDRDFATIADVRPLRHHYLDL
jgi:hypothetical protein